ncbi:hypothetical protein O5167_15405 [Escherichia coli]|nr:hypothetical protein [Escherichia coli]
MIIVELKDWNHQPVTARGDTWFKGDKNMGRSPVSVTRSKNSCWTKTQASGRPFYEQRLYPDCSFFVVMTGNADFSALPEEQRRHTISLKDFLKFADRGASITISNRTQLPRFLTRISIFSMICS